MGEDRAQRQHHLDARGHWVPNSKARVESKGKTDRREMVVERRGQWAAGGMQRKSRKGGAGGQAQWGGSGEAVVLQKLLPTTARAPRSHPAPSRHLLRRQQRRVVFL